MKISIIVGTRPEIIKMSSIIKTADKEKLDYDIIHTEQHYNYELNKIFFEELELPLPDYSLNVGSGTQAQQTANAMIKIEEILIKTKPDLVLVQGDTNTVLAGALTATKLNIKVGHVEAGLRSYDNRMPEEHNRRLTDHLSFYLFAPTQVNKKILKDEKTWGKIFVTGNTIIDACLEYMPVAEKKSKIMNDINFEKFALATAHRAENVDNLKVLKEVIKIFTESPIPIVYPIHPRTVKRLKEDKLYDKIKNHNNILLMKPVGYFDLLMLMKNCSYILTDSGGIQEEATAPNIRKKVFILRKSTERTEAVKSGYAELMGTNADFVLKRTNSFLKDQETLRVPSPFGDGKSGKRIVKIIRNIN